MRDLDKILKSFEEIRDREEKLSKITKEYWETVSPSNFAPFTEYDELSGFFEGLALGEPEICEELRNWLYEGYSIPSTWTYQGRGYWIKDYESFKNYLFDVYQP